MNRALKAMLAYDISQSKTKFITQPSGKLTSLGAIIYETVAEPMKLVVVSPTPVSPFINDLIYIATLTLTSPFIAPHKNIWSIIANNIETHISRPPILHNVDSVNVFDPKAIQPYFPINCVSIDVFGIKQTQYSGGPTGYHSNDLVSPSGL